MGNWIRVSDQLPEFGRPVIVCRKASGGRIAVEAGIREVNGWWRTYGTRSKSVSHALFVRP